MNSVDILIMFGIFISIIIWAGQSLWIYLDARMRRDRFAILWALLAMCSMPITLIVYLIVTRSTEMRCKSCGAIVEKGTEICTNCGKTLGKHCKSCGGFMEDNWNYCPSCKAKY